MKVRIFSGGNYEILENDINLFLDRGVTVRHVLQTQDADEGGWVTITVFYDENDDALDCLVLKGEINANRAI